LPSDWDNMALRRIKSFGSNFDILVERSEENLKITIKEGATIVHQSIVKNGTSIKVNLD